MTRDLDPNAKPTWLHGRDMEWSRLVDFVTPERPGASLALVYGRRRQGKTMLLEALAATTGAFYWQAIEQSAAQNLVSFSGAWARWVGDTTGRQFTSWAAAVDALFNPPTDRSSVMLIDEFGYLAATAPEIASLLQAQLTPSATRSGRARLVLCGSAYAQMRSLLDGSAPLRGRATLELLVGPFDFRTAADYWGVADQLDVAFRLHAIVGGTPGYLALAGSTPDLRRFDAWIERRLLDPTAPLFREGRIMVSEDTSLSDRALYWGVLAAIAEGRSRRHEIADALGRTEHSIGFPLRVLVEGGWVEQVPDLFHSARSMYRLTEPLIRFHRLVIEPDEGRLRRGQASAVLQDARGTIGRQILGPHLEWMAAEWAMAFADPASLGGRPRVVGSGTLRTQGAAFQIDLIGSQPSSNGSSEIHCIGEVKAGEARAGIEQLRRLDHIVGLLGERAASEVRRLLVARRGFTAELERIAASRRDVELIGLDRLYDGT